MAISLFVIWDDERRRALAVRDRFAAKPLYSEPTTSGIRFATEVKQLVATSTRRPAPNDDAVAEYLSGRYTDPRHTFFAGVGKVPPASYVLAEDGRVSERKYWSPDFTRPDSGADVDIAAGFRDRLVDAVHRRIATSTGAAAHLTGGLDSTAITAAAVIGLNQTGETTPIHTVSAAFPGYDIDESPWIDDVARTQPFPHHYFVPQSETVADIETVLWESDSPVHNRILGIWAGTAEIAAAAGADLVLMGTGGDEVLDQTQLVADLIRLGAFGQWWRAVAGEAAWRGTPLAIPTAHSMRLAAPPSVRGAAGLRHLRRSRPGPGLITDGFFSALPQSSNAADPRSPSAPSQTQARAGAAGSDPFRVRLNETQEAEYAQRGIAVTYPYLDRTVVEFVASLSPLDRPFDGSSKSLVRTAFTDHLPHSVLSRRTKTLADDYLAAEFMRLSDSYCRRFPTVPGAAERYIDAGRYVAALSRIRQLDPDRETRSALWNAWTLFLWLDGLGRYRSRAAHLDQ